MSASDKTKCRSTACAITVAPAAAGCAAGILLGRTMSARTGNVAAAGLLLAGVAVALPTVIDFVAKSLNRPGSRRGSERRLRGIRDGASPLNSVTSTVSEPDEYEHV